MAIHALSTPSMPHRPGQEDIITTAARAVAVMLAFSVIAMLLTQTVALVSPRTRTSTAVVASNSNSHINTKHATPAVSKKTRCFLDIAIDDVEIGRVVIELESTLVPKASENFRSLATGERGPQFHYKGKSFHRIIPGFVVQGGDLHLIDPADRASLRFDDEPSGLALKHDARYLVQMANSGPNTNGSQFCFMLGAAPHLNGKHVVFGRVIEGFEVVDQMEKAGTQQGTPTSRVLIVDSGEL